MLDMGPLLLLFSHVLVGQALNVPIFTTNFTNQMFTFHVHWFQYSGPVTFLSVTYGLSVSFPEDDIGIALVGDTLSFHCYALSP